MRSADRPTPHVPLVALAGLSAIALLVGPGCSTIDGQRSVDGRVSSAPAKAGKDQDAKELEKKRRGLVEKRHELELARLGLRIEEQKAGAKETELARELELAQAEVSEAEATLSVFEKIERASKLGRAQVALDRASQRLEEARAELEELEAMYADEEFAERTKELVLLRGRRNLEIAQRSFELEQRDFEVLDGYTLPKEEREKVRAVDKTRAALEEKRRESETGQLERRVALEKARFAIEKLEHELAELQFELAEPQG